MSKEVKNKSEAKAEAQPVRQQIYPIENVANFRNIALFATILGILFQASFLYTISPTLLSYMTVSNTFLRVGVAVPLLSWIALVVVDFLDDNEKRLARGQGFKGSSSQKTHLLVIGIAALLFVLVIINISLTTPWSELSWEKFQPTLATAFKIFGGLFVVGALLMYLWQFSALRFDAEENGTVESKFLIQFVSFSIIITALLGMTFSYFKSYEYCEFRTPNGLENAEFVIALDQVTVFKLTGQTVIVNNRQIERITCGLDRPQQAQKS